MKSEDLHRGILALRDCGVIMANTWHPVYSQLTRSGLAIRRPLPVPRGHKSLFTLGERGKRYVDRHAR